MSSPATFGARRRACLRPFVPVLITAPWRELLLGALGVGLLCTEWISRHALAMRSRLWTPASAWWA
ncbi:hypothetical protein H5407_00065 [Mitsuaria sp. WAJ17]|uniref:hypothetical protein n=1 Tax=Mitsuaria sp. WAJ17 TaxID=2761452 RepID=UPI0016029DBB|nr:hypothetical protein [Mitsuaria sp. WAJ17]MBB2483612.1 hypothetical protein [Mitsuaria sp. WAJ17]